MFLSVFAVYELITKQLYRSFIAERQIKHLMVLGLIYIFICFTVLEDIICFLSSHKQGIARLFELNSKQALQLKETRHNNKS